jgi:hypothetical protein
MHLLFFRLAPPLPHVVVLMEEWYILQLAPPLRAVPSPGGAAGSPRPSQLARSRLYRLPLFLVCSGWLVRRFFFFDACDCWPWLAYVVWADMNTTGFNVD